MERGKTTKTKFSIVLVVVLVVEVRLSRSLEGSGRLNVTDVRRERIPPLWSTVRERAMAKDFNVADANRPCVPRRTKLPGRGVGLHNEN